MSMSSLNGETVELALVSKPGYFGIVVILTSHHPEKVVHCDFKASIVA